MKNDILKQYSLGDMTVTYMTDNEGHVGFSFLPTGRLDRSRITENDLEPLVELYVRGDTFSEELINGLSLCGSQSTKRLTYRSQKVSETAGETTITTTMEDERGYAVLHILSYDEGKRAFSVRTVFENRSAGEVVLENLSSFSFGGLSAFGDARATDRMTIHRVRSWWSAEGKIDSRTLTDYHLEPSWSLTGYRTEKFGQTGSLPVRRFFPFIAIEEAEEDVTWAVQLCCPLSWQIEVRRVREYLCVSGGLADYEFGHWSKTLKPGERFEAPRAFLTVGSGGLDKVSQRLQSLHAVPGCTDKPLPVLFNEFCTTWGNANEENIGKILHALQGRDIDTFVIDAGWFGDGNWDRLIGDWNVSPDRFPSGIGKTVKRITDAGMNAGIWFEPENCTTYSSVSKEHPEWLLKRNGYFISGRRQFLNMTHPKVREYLQVKVIDFLKEHGFKYIKIDYNDSIGMGCDDPDGLGEGLRKQLMGTQDFFREIRKQVPGITIESCSSGGHRLEPSMMALCDMASFSDAHECVYIPIIAAHLHRLIRPEQSQIWAVLRQEDTLRRTNFSLVNTLLGVMCLSGDVYDLSPEQWKTVDRAIAFYRTVSSVIRNGESAFFGSNIHSWVDPKGWQAVVRCEEKSGQTMVVLHTFGGALPEKVRVPVRAAKIDNVLCSEGNEICLKENKLEIELKANFEAVAVSLSV